MEIKKEVGTRQIGLFDFIKKSILNAFLEVLDVASVAACFCTIFWLLYFCFVKDFVEIILVAALKCINRIAWISNITGVCKLLDYIKCSLLTDIKTPNCSNGATDCLEHDEVFHSSPAILSVTSYDHNESQHHLRCSPTETPRSSTCKLVSPRRIDLNSEDRCKRDIAYVSPVQQHSSFKSKIFNWNFDRLKFDSESCSKENYSSPNCVNKVKEAIAKNLRLSPAVRDDKEKLIEDESPERIGCCRNLFAFLKLKFQTIQSPSSVHYKRF